MLYCDCDCLCLELYAMKYVYYLVLIIGTVYLVGWCGWSKWSWVITFMLAHIENGIKITFRDK